MKYFILFILMCGTSYSQSEQAKVSVKYKEITQNFLIRQKALNVIKIRLAYYYNGFNPQLKNGAISATRLISKDC
jgi:hypothetical protein